MTHPEAEKFVLKSFNGLVRRNGKYLGDYTYVFIIGKLPDGSEEVILVSNAINSIIRQIVA